MDSCQGLFILFVIVMVAKKEEEHFYISGRAEYTSEVKVALS